jgi:membrane protease YdiL (CAAX protease family)
VTESREQMLMLELAMLSSVTSFAGISLLFRFGNRSSGTTQRLRHYLRAQRQRGGLARVLLVASAAFAASLVGNTGIQTYRMMTGPYVSYKQEDPQVRSAAISSSPVVVSVITCLGPIAEEVVFRVLLFGHLLVTTGPAAAYLISSGVFGLLHVHQSNDEPEPEAAAASSSSSSSSSSASSGAAAAVPASTGSKMVETGWHGFCLAAAYHLSGVLLVPVLLHMANNALCCLPLICLNPEVSSATRGRVFAAMFRFNRSDMQLQHWLLLQFTRRGRRCVSQQAGLQWFDAATLEPTPAYLEMSRRMHQWLTDSDEGGGGQLTPDTLAVLMTHDPMVSCGVCASTSATCILRLVSAFCRFSHFSPCLSLFLSLSHTHTHTPHSNSCATCCTTWTRPWRPAPPCLAAGRPLCWPKWPRRPRPAARSRRRTRPRRWWPPRASITGT